ncbi:MAG: DUF4244 domain-containing protein [Streptomycetales bacterium]
MRADPALRPLLRAVSAVTGGLRWPLRRLDVLSDRGMSTAEYAVGTVAAVGFAGVLYKVVTSDAVMGALSDIVRRALALPF